MDICRRKNKLLRNYMKKTSYGNIFKKVAIVAIIVLVISIIYFSKRIFNPCPLWYERFLLVVLISLLVSVVFYCLDDRVIKLSLKNFITINVPFQIDSQIAGSVAVFFLTLIISSVILFNLPQQQLPCTLLPPELTINGEVKKANTQEKLQNVNVETDISDKNTINPSNAKTNEVGGFSFRLSQNQNILDKDLRIKFSKSGFGTEVVNNKIKNLTNKYLLVEMYPINSCDDFIKQINFEILNNIQEDLIKTNIDTRKISLSSLVDKFIKDELPSLIKDLNSNRDLNSNIDTNKCIEKYRFLKTNLNDEFKDFLVGGYEIGESLENYLENIVNLYARLLDGMWDFKISKIKVAGFADGQRYTSSEPLLIKEGTPLLDMEKCPENKPKLPDSAIPRDLSYINLTPDAKNNFSKIDTIDNNCNLSSVRAYTVAVYLAKKLKRQPNDGLEIFYAAGGEKGVKNEDNPNNRKVVIYLELKSMRKEN